MNKCPSCLALLEPSTPNTYVDRYGKPVEEPAGEVCVNETCPYFNTVIEDVRIKTTAEEVQEHYELAQRILNDKTLIGSKDILIKCDAVLAICEKYKRMERLLEWLLCQAGHKDGRIPKEECDMIEKVLSFDPLSE